MPRISPNGKNLGMVEELGELFVYLMETNQVSEVLLLGVAMGNNGGWGGRGGWPWVGGSIGAIGVMGRSEECNLAYEDCGSDRSSIFEACKDYGSACEDCDSDRNGISDACENCGSDRSGISEACEDCGSACGDCGLDRSDVSKACKDCCSSRLSVSEAYKDGIDGSGMEVRLGGENFSFEMFSN
ncbi:unnamed protein product [Prunus armeniaca]